jgi:phage-related protein
MILHAFIKKTKKTPKKELKIARQRLKEMHNENS